MVFIDLSKHFDTGRRSDLWILLRRYGCPETFIKIIQECHDGMAGAMASQLRRTGHIIRMNDNRITKAVFYGELAKEKRLHGEQRCDTKM